MPNIQVPKPNIPLLSFTYISFGIVFRTYFRLRLRRDNQRLKALAAQDRPLIVVFNHASYLDVPAVGLGLGLKLMRRMTLPGKKELFEGGLTRWLVKMGSVIPVDREMADTSAVRGLLRALQQGHDILMSPEGTRSPDGIVHPFQVGFAKLAHKANALVVPVGIRGAAQALPRGAHIPRPKRITVVIGEALDPQVYLQGKPDPSAFAAFAEATRQAIIELISQPQNTEAVV
jgi:1-acyl-sn-glycerol-3-phosphate acyltransferase